MSVRKFAPFVIMLAASLWAIDGLFRTNLTAVIPPAAIVFYEHLLGSIFLLPFIFKFKSQIQKLSKHDWLVVVMMALLSSTLGTLLFTEALARSFAVGDFATPILLQKLQPIFVVLLSAVILKEKLSGRFLSWVLVALVGSYMISFGTEAIQLQLAGKELIVLLSIGAAAAWGSGTIMSKYLVDRIDYRATTALRFLLTVPISLVAMFALSQTFAPASFDFELGWRLLLIAAVTGGAGALLLYYFGLKNTKAKVSTIAELAFPLVTLIIATTSLNPYGQAQSLTLANIFGVVLLVISMLMVSLEYNKS